MQLSDLAQALPGILVAVLLPGYLVATLLAPRWQNWERLAMAPGLSAGFFGVLGLGMRRVHIPFEPATVFPAIALLGAAAVLRRRRAGSNPASDIPWWIPIPALVAGCAAAAAFAWGLHGQVLPPDWDPRVHAGTAALIARTHDVLPLFPIPLEHTAFARARPGFEAMTAVVSWVGGPAPAFSMAPVVTAFLVLMPLGLAMLALEVTGSVALALVVPLLAAGLPFPVDQAVLGRFPQIADSILVAPYIVAVLRLLRGRQIVDNAMLLLAITASIFVVHGLEIFTAVLVGMVPMAWAAFSALRASPRPAILRMGAVAGATLAGALIVTVLTKLPLVPPANPIEGSTSVPASTIQPFHFQTFFQTFTQTELTSPLAVALYCVGVVAILRFYRHLLWALVAHVVFLAMLADALFWHQVNNFKNESLFPYGQLDRVPGLQYWVLPFILGAGFLAVVALTRTIARQRRSRPWLALGAAAAAVVAVLIQGRIEHRWSVLFGGSMPIGIYPMDYFDTLTNLGSWWLLLAVAGGFVVVGCAVASRNLGLPRLVHARLGTTWGPGLDAAAVALAGLVVLMLGVGARADLNLYERLVISRGVVTPADVTVLDQMSAMLPPGTLVQTDGLDDAGQYLTALTDLTPLVPAGYESGPLSIPLLQALANACTDPVGAEQALSQVGAVFVGSHYIREGAYYVWSADCIGRLPNVRLIASDSYQGQRAAAFAVLR